MWNMKLDFSDIALLLMGLVWHYSWKIYENKISLGRLNLCLWFHNLK